MTLLCIAAIGLLYTGSLQRALLAIEPRCTVGITGTAATLTIEGWTANQDCQTIVSGGHSFIGSVDPSQVYLYTTTPTNPVVCEVDVEGRHLIVRDDGILKLVGNALCQSLRSSASASTSAALVAQSTAQPQPTATVANPLPPAPAPTPPGIWCRNDGYPSIGNANCEIYPSPYAPQPGEHTAAEACDTAGCSTTASATMQGPWAIVAGCYPETTPNNRIIVDVSLDYDGFTYDSWGYVPCTGEQNGHFAYYEYRRSANGIVTVTASDDSGHGGLGSGFDIDLVQR